MLRSQHLSATGHLNADHTESVCQCLYDDTVELTRQHCTLQCTASPLAVKHRHVLRRVGHPKCPCQLLLPVHAVTLAVTGQWRRLLPLHDCHVADATPTAALDALGH